MYKSLSQDLGLSHTTCGLEHSLLFGHLHGRFVSYQSRGRYDKSNPIQRYEHFGTLFLGLERVDRLLRPNLKSYRLSNVGTELIIALIRPCIRISPT